jgi:hypothetical protein
MNIERASGALLLVLPIAFNTLFFLLARLFDYPDILRNPTAEILSRFQAGGVRLKLLWYGFMLTAVLLAPLAVLRGRGQGAATGGLTARAWPDLAPKARRAGRQRLRSRWRRPGRSRRVGGCTWAGRATGRSGGATWRSSSRRFGVGSRAARSGALASHARQKRVVLDLGAP